MQVGSTIDFTITVKNTGNVAYTDLISLADVLNGAALSFNSKDITGFKAKSSTDIDRTSELLGGLPGTDALSLAGALPAIETPSQGPSGTLSGLEVNEVVTITYSYTVKATDSVVTNIVTADNNTSGTPTIKVDDNKAYTTAKTYEIQKAAANNDPAKANVAQVGDTIKYTVTVTNTGNVETGEVTLTDTFQGAGELVGEAVAQGEGGEYTVTVGSAEVGATSQATYTYIVQASDKMISNAIGTEPGQKTEVNVDDNLGYSVAKTAEVNGVPLVQGETAAAGDEITYTVTVTNEGNVEIRDLELTDTFTGHGVLAGDSLAQGENGNYTVEVPVVPVGESRSISYTCTVQPDDETVSNTVIGPNGTESGTITEVEQATVTYQDGLGGALFADRPYALAVGSPTPAFGTPVPQRTGYYFNGWSPEVAEKVTGDATYVAQWSPTGDTAYRIEYYMQNVDDDGYTMDASLTESRESNADEEVRASVKQVPGFAHVVTADSVESGVVDPAGTTVLKVYYDRNLYTVSYQYTGVVPAGASALPASQTYRYGQTVQVAPDATAAGYTFSGWGVTGSLVMGGSDIVLEGSFAAVPMVPVTPPVTPVTPTVPVVTPTAATPATPATPAPATPAPAAEPIEDDATPQAAAPAERTPLAETEEIEDEGTPMGAFDEPHCWVHWVMLLGILITAAYGLVVVRRRLHLADDVDDYEKQVLGIEDEATEAVPATGRQAL